MDTKKPFCASVAALLLSVLALPAHAIWTTVDGGTFSSMSSSFTVDFGVSPLNNSAPLPDSLPSGTLGGIQYSFTGGALFNYDSSSSLPDGTSARPPGSTGNFWSIGDTPQAHVGPGIVNLVGGAGYVGFLWGSPDSYNIVSFYDGNQLLASFDGSAIKVPPNGDQSYSRYFNVFAGAGETITSVTFASSTNNAFETDNFAFSASPIPEPETYALMLAGLGLLGIAGRRRKYREAGAA